jgi:hypothetical protein
VRDRLTIVEPNGLEARGLAGGADRDAAAAGQQHIVDILHRLIDDQEQDH